MWQAEPSPGAHAATAPIGTRAEEEALTVSTGGIQPPPSPHPPSPSAPAPPEVEQAAAQRGFGTLLDSRLFNRPVVTASIYLAFGVGCFVLLLVSSWLISSVFHPRSFSLGWSILRIVPLLFCFGMVIAPVYAVRILVIGTRGDTAGKLLRYDLVPMSGSPVPLPIVIEDGRDRFLDHVIAALRQHGRPIN